MRGINEVRLIGNLGRDPEIRATPSGNSVASLALATDESYKDKQSGQLVQKVEWHRISAFGKLADILGQYAKKGSKLYVGGRLETQKWQDQSGQDRYTTQIVATDIRLLDARPDGQQAQQPAQQQSNPVPNSLPSDEWDQEIPFSDYLGKLVAKVI